METTKVFSDIVAALVDPAIRIIALKGSTRSSKTWSALQALDIVAARSKRPRLISVVSETMPHLKRGAIRDFKNMLAVDNAYDDNKWHDTDKTYSYGKGVMEFFSADQASKVMGPARDWLYMNECINMSFDVYRQLSVRTTEKIILDYNPAFEFWVDSKILPRADCKMIHSTYLDNDMLTASQVSEIESNRLLDPEWFQVYGLGQTGSKEGLVIKNWDIVASMPPRSLWKRAYIGIDFGWTAPSAAMLVVESQGEVYIDELAYGPHMGTEDLAEAIILEGYADLEAICDEADPRAIKELQGYGIRRAKPTKNKEIKTGLSIMNRYKKHYTARSLNSIQENRMYRYPKDEHGNYGIVPIKAHGHAKDAERYVFLNELANIPAGYDVTVSSTGKK